MKNLINIKRMIFFFFVVTGLKILQSCVVYHPYNSAEMVTVQDIVLMSKDGVSSRDIISEIRHSHTIYALKADQLATLQDEGVQDSVINYKVLPGVHEVVSNARLILLAKHHMISALIADKHNACII